MGTFDLRGTEEPLDIHLGILWPGRDGLMGGPTRLSELSAVSVADARGRHHAMESLGELVQVDAPTRWTHTGGRRAATVGASLTGRPAASVVDEIRPRLDALSGSWPTGVRAQIGGETDDTAETFADVPALYALLTPDRARG